MSFQAYQRQDGSKGIRNAVIIAYMVECARHVAQEITLRFRGRPVQMIGFPGCYPNDYAGRMMRALCTHPNVGAVLLVSLGCEGMNRGALLEHVRTSGRPAELLVIQETGGTRRTIEAGARWVDATLGQLAETKRVGMEVSELVVGTICGGSDSTSGLTANPAIGVAFDLLVAEGARAIFEETGELIGLEQVMAERAATPALAEEILACMRKTESYYRTLGQSSFAIGNADGGLTTIEEKSLGAYAKSGNSRIAGLIKPGDVPPAPGLYLLDVVPDGPVRFGFPNINDNAEIGELIACGSHLILFSTGRGSVVGSAIAPVVKICGNPHTFRRMEDDMDVNAGAILEGAATLASVGQEIFECVRGVAAGMETKSEMLGHQEFVLTYKSFTPIGPACLPGAA
jgi:altronate dehydratase large subunit